MLLSPIQALADWREEIGVFRIGIVTKDDLTGTLARIEPFRLAVTEALEMDVEFFPASNSRSVIEALTAERIEYAILSASGYSLASVQCQCIEPLVVPRSTDSTDGYHLVGIMKADRSFEASDLNTMKVGMLSRGSVLGEKFVEYLLSQEYSDFQPGSVNFGSAESSEQTLNDFVDGEFGLSALLFAMKLNKTKCAVSPSCSSRRCFLDTLGTIGFRIFSPIVYHAAQRWF